MHADALWPDGPQFIRRDGVFPLGTDSVLLASFSQNMRDRRACDPAAAPACCPYYWRGTPSLSVDAVDILPPRWRTHGKTRR